ncbi:MAG: hypothetical protein RSA98_05180 [Odoribacter sp.]
MQQIALSLQPLSEMMTGEWIRLIQAKYWKRFLKKSFEKIWKGREESIIFATAFTTKKVVERYRETKD